MSPRLPSSAVTKVLPETEGFAVVHSGQDLRRLDWFGVKHALAHVLSLRVVNSLLHLFASVFLSTKIRHRLPLSRRITKYQLQNGTHVTLADTLNDVVAKDIYWGRGRPESPATWRALRLTENLARVTKTFLDVGSYSGVFALVAARANSNLGALTFEIVPENFYLLIRNIVENDLIASFTPQLLGVGSQEATFRVPISLGLATYASSISLQSKFESGVQVPVATLDVVTSGKPGPFTMKIDVEGFEANVFEGGREFIRRELPDIICELLPGADGAVEIFHQLQPIGYNFFIITDEGFEQRLELIPDLKWRDWLFSARSDIKEILRQTD